MASEKAVANGNGDNLSFDYVARSRNGQQVKGRIEAPGVRAVVGHLKELQLIPIDITQAKTEGLNRDIELPGFMASRVKIKDLAIMTRQMATMISAGLPLIRSLAILEDQTESKPLAEALGKVRTDVENGYSFSDGLQRQGNAFPLLMVSMVRAGEVGGFLDKALLAIATNYEKEVKLRSKVKSAMTYPLVVLAIALLAVAFMLIFIVPIFVGMYDSLGGELPWVTQVLVTLSQQMVWILPVLLVLAIAVWWWYSRHKNDDEVRRRVDTFLLKLPVFGPLLQKVALSRFSRMLSAMLGAGVPLLQAIDVVSKTSGNWQIEQALNDVQDNVRAGQSLAEPLKEHEVFPPMVSQMMMVGEESGSLEPMLVKISDFYDQEVEATTEQLASLIEPILIVIIGIIVGGMVIALYLPMFSIYDQIGKQA